MGARGIQRVAAFSARLSGQHPDSLHDSDSKFKFITLDVQKPTAFTAAHSLLGPAQGRCMHWAAAFTRPDSRPTHDVDGCLPAPGSPGPSRRCTAECGAAIRAGSRLPRPPVRVLRVSWPAGCWARACRACGCRAAILPRCPRRSAPRPHLGHRERRPSEAKAKKGKAALPGPTGPAQLQQTRQNMTALVVQTQRQ